MSLAAVAAVGIPQMGQAQAVVEQGDLFITLLLQLHHQQFLLLLVLAVLVVQSELIME